jgi:uracil-DNA glycosylase family 4
LQPRRASGKIAAMGDVWLRRRLELEKLMGVDALMTMPSTPAQSGVEAELEATQELVAVCTGCRLHQGRTHTVFARGNPQAELMFIGEAPGHEEDVQGYPFVGPAGKLLDKMIFAMGLGREEVYVANILKCRPPGNRDPRPDEIEACYPFLKRQIELVSPRIICTLGRPASNTLLRTSASMGSLRGRWHDFDGIRLMPTYHPAYLLRSPGQKRKAWEDLKQVILALQEP